MLLIILLSIRCEGFINKLEKRPTNPPQSFNSNTYTITDLPLPKQSRNYYIYTPTTKPPSTGFPYVVYYSFMKMMGLYSKTMLVLQDQGFVH